MNKQLTIAIIMRCKNEMPYVVESLEALKKQTLDYTLYTYNSNSTDGSEGYIKSAVTDPARYVEQGNKPYMPGVVLNDMVSRTKEDIIVLLNADAIPQNDTWLERLVAPILKGRAKFTMSKQVPRLKAHHVVKYDYERAYSEDIFAKNPYFFSAVSAAFMRSLWEEKKFYEEGFSEDMIWAAHHRDQGIPFEYCPKSVVEHSHNYTFKQLIERKMHEAIAEYYFCPQAPSMIRLAFQCVKEILRDIGWIFKTDGFETIPYNVLYRICIYFGYYKGYKLARQRARIR